ncbi:MAG: ferredoxin [Bdellovibrionales bacterium]|nr:ferredoxin [Bdellovibrionales bacterium]
MNVVLISFSLALVLALGLVFTLGGLSLLSGAMEFFFGKPKLYFLKSSAKKKFSFGFRFNDDKEPAKFDMVRVRQYNPFGSPTQTEVTRSFSPQGSSFATEVELGESLTQMQKSAGLDKSIISVTLFSSKDGISHEFNFKGQVFMDKMAHAVETLEEFEKKFKPKKVKPLYQTTSKSFIAEPLPKSGAQLKLATNPQFAGDFAAAAGAEGGAAVETFSVSKVWIEAGCIICNACEDIAPDVFLVNDEGCIVKDGAPLENGPLIEEAAEACPVEIIKFNKA